MTNLMTVSNQWASRPDDQRFLTMEALLEAVQKHRQTSKVFNINLEKAKVAPSEDGDIHLIDQNEDLGSMSHWAFGQLCAKVSTPAEYLRSLPPELACINLQWGLENGRNTDYVKLLNRDNTVGAMTSTSYGRIWDEEIAAAMIRNVDLDVWKVPSASYSAKDPLRATTLYASDRDMFVFLVNENAGVDSAGENLKRGVIVWNSEVGSATFGIATFLYDYVCDNRIIWGAREYRDMKLRHSLNAPTRFVEQAVPMLAEYASSSVLSLEGSIQAAKAREVAKDKLGVIDWLSKRGFTKGQAKEAYEISESGGNTGRIYNPRSVWGIVQGMTEAAQRIKHTNTRIAVETKAGALMEKM